MCGGLASCDRAEKRHVGQNYRRTLLVFLPWSQCCAKLYTESWGMVACEAKVSVVTSLYDIHNHAHVVILLIVCRSDVRYPHFCVRMLRL